MTDIYVNLVFQHREKLIPVDSLEDAKAMILTIHSAENRNVLFQDKSGLAITIQCKDVLIAHVVTRQKGISASIP